MKKISLYFAVLFAVLGLASCQQDRDPVLSLPTEYVLNTPTMQNQYIDLVAGNTLELVSSQPDYGYAAVANYSAEMSLTGNFEDDEFYALDPINAHLARMTFKQEDIATGICKLLNIEDEDGYNAKFPEGQPYMQIYFRAICQLSGVEGSLIYSNVVSYDNIKGYLAIPSPGYIYLVGTPEGWAGPTESNAAHYDEWRLFEPKSAIGSKVYTGVFDLPEAPIFRFYTALTGWDADSYGTQDPDEPIEFPEFNGDNKFDGKLVKGKGSFSFPNFAGGTVTIVVDMQDPSNMTVELLPGNVTPTVTTYVYMVGNNGGWAEPNPDNYANWKLACSDDSGVYAATFDFADFDADGGSLYCRFYKDPKGWGNAEWSSDAGGGNVTCASGVAYPTFVGEGCFTLPVAGHKVQVVLDTNTNQVTFTYVD